MKILGWAGFRVINAMGQKHGMDSETGVPSDRSQRKREVSCHVVGE